MGSIITVLTPALSHDLTTIETAKMELGVANDDVSEDNKIFSHIRQASSQIASYCNRVFGLETIEERFIDVSFNRELRLRRRPVAQILSLTDSEALVDTGDYFVDKESAIVYRRTSWVSRYYHPWSFGREIVATYSAGYNLLDDLPHALEKACLNLVKQYYFSISQNPYLRSEDIPGVASYAYGFGPSAARDGTDLPPDVRVLIDPFKELCYA